MVKEYEDVLKVWNNVDNQIVDNNVHALKFVSELCKTKEMCYKAVNSYSSSIQFVPECYKTQEMCY